MDDQDKHRSSNSESASTSPSPSDPISADDSLNAVQRSFLAASTLSLPPPAASSGRTLLPGPIAYTISLATRSTSFAVRLGTGVCGFGLDAARATTLSSLELGRGLVEGILAAAGKDVVQRSGGARGTSALARQNAESVLERSLESLHLAVTHAVFWTTAGFRVTGATLGAVSDVTLLLLSSLDQICGSTESSRAIASIITLIRKEFRNDSSSSLSGGDTEGKDSAAGRGEKVGVIDLVLALAGIAYLQRWCRRLIEEEDRELGIEETLWDVVVLSDGDRLDVHDDSLYGSHPGSYRRRQQQEQQVSPRERSSADDGLGRAVGGNGRGGALERGRGGGDSSSDDDGDLPELRLKRHLMRNLPADTSVSITTETTTTKTITVDITGHRRLVFSPPPGVEVLEDRKLPASEWAGRKEKSATDAAAASPVADRSEDPVTYRVVYRVNHNKLRSTTIEREELSDDDASTGFVEGTDDSASDDSATAEPLSEDDDDAPPPLPPKSKPTATAPARPRETSSTATTPKRTSPTRSSSIPLPSKRTPTGNPSGKRNVANQKRPRIPLGAASATSTNNNDLSRQSSLSPSRFLAKMTKPESGEKKSNSFRNAFKKGHVPALSNLLPGTRTTKPPIPPRTTSAPTSTSAPAPLTTAAPNPIARPTSRASYISVHEHQRDSIVSQTGTFSIHSQTPAKNGAGGGADDAASLLRPVSPTVVRSTASEHASTTREREHGARSGSITKSQSERAMAGLRSSDDKGYRRVRSQIYGAQGPYMAGEAASPSQTSLVLSTYFTDPADHVSIHRQPSVSSIQCRHPSPYAHPSALSTLRRTGRAPSQFPADVHLLRNVARYMRFSSAAYGSRFLRFMGISRQMPPALVRRAATDPALADTHHEVRSFARHASLGRKDHGEEDGPASVLLSSFVDPAGGSNSRGETGTGVPLVHYVALDHESRAVVLACRGTLGFEDVLADMTCDYDDLLWPGGGSRRGKKYKVHKGIHASARRLLYGDDGRVLATLRRALEDWPEYGLVLTGHSLGGAVTALLGVMLAKPAGDDKAGFVTAGEGAVGGSDEHDHHHQIALPAGRPIHVYAYGPPGTMSPALRLATRGLITSIVHGNDLVPYLSLGTLHDLQAAALAFKRDDLPEGDGASPAERATASSGRALLHARIWASLRAGLAERWYSAVPPDATSGTDDALWASLGLLRRATRSHGKLKLVPPGEVFVVESRRVLRREAFLFVPGSSCDRGADGAGKRDGANGGWGAGVVSAATAAADMAARPARRIVCRYVKDVERKFGEVRFSASMLTDHSPAKYEEAIEGLRRGVMEWA